MHTAYIEGRTLTDAERAEAALHVESKKEGKLTGWPEGFEQSNACNDPCDMWDGPCACGAWHKDGR